MQSIDYGLVSFTPKENWRTGGLEEQAAKALFSQNPDVSVEELIQYGGGEAKKAIERVSKEFEALPHKKLSEAAKIEIQARIKTAKETSVSRRSSQIAGNLLLGGAVSDKKKETLVKVYIQSGGKLKHINNAFNEAVKNRGLTADEKHKALDHLCLAEVEKETYVSRSWKRRIRNFFTSASMSRSREIVLKANQDPDQSYLLHAVKDGRIEALKVLIDAGCDLSEGNNLLHLAAKEGHAEVVQLLLKHNPELSIERNTKGDYPIHTAVENGQLSVIKKLLELDPETPSYQNKNNKDPIDLAMDNGNIPVIEKLLEGVAVTPDWAGDLLKVYSKKNQATTILKELDGQYDLVFKNSPEIIQELLAHDTEVGRDFVEQLMIGLKDKHNRWKALTALIDSNDYKMLDKVFDSYQKDILRFSKMGEPILQYAIKNKKTAILAKVLGRRVGQKRLETKNKLGFTPLQVAVQEKQGGYIKFLLQKGANPTVLDAEGNSLFHMAIEMGDVNFVRFLAQDPKMKKLINQRNEQGESPIEVAAKMGREDMVMQFLSMGASSKPNDKNENLLHLAVQSGNHRLVQTLVNAAPPLVRQVDKSGKQPIDVAIEKGDKKIAAFLSGEEKPAFRAIMQGDKDGFMTALEENPDLFATRSNGESLLGVALRMEQNEIVEILKEKEEFLLLLLHEDQELFNDEIDKRGAQLRSELQKKRVWPREQAQKVALQKQKIYRETLEHAVKLGLADDVNSLLELARRDRVDQGFAFGLKPHEHPLINAMNLGNLEIVESFLQAEGFQSSQMGPELLKVALENRKSEIVDMILENKEYHYLINGLSSDGLSAFHRAVKDGDMELAKKLGEYADLAQVGSQGNTALHWAILTGDSEMVRFILEMDKEKILLNQENRFGVLPLMNAARMGDIKQLEVLIEAGAKIDAKDQRGNTVLHWAESVPMIEYLLGNSEVKALLETKNNDGRTPLMKAVEYMDEKKAVALLQAGARIDQVDKVGNNVLHIALYVTNLGGDSVVYENTLSAILEFPGGEKLLNMKNNAGYTPLLEGARKMNFLSAKLVRPLLQNVIAYGAKIDGEDERGKTLLHHVIADGDIETIQRVLDHPDAKDLMQVGDFIGATPINLVQEKIEKIEKSVEKLDYYLRNTELVEKQRRLVHFRYWVRAPKEEAERLASQQSPGAKERSERWVAQEKVRLAAKKEKLQKWKNLLTSMERVIQK